MKRIIKEMSGGVARKWHIVILPDEEYCEYAQRVANFTSAFNKSSKIYSTYVKDGFMPVLFRNEVSFLFNELEIPSDVAGLICKSTAHKFGYIDKNDNITES